MHKAEAAQARLGHAEGLLWGGISSRTVSLILSLTQQILIKPLLFWRPSPRACGGQTTGVPSHLCPGLDGDCPPTWPWVPGGGGPKKASFEEETNTPYHPTTATKAVST